MGTLFQLANYHATTLLAEARRTTLYRATRTTDQRAVVLKTLSDNYPSPSQTRTVEFENHILEKLQGPGIISVVTIEHVGLTPTLVLEDYGGTSLDRHFLPLPLDKFFRVATDAVKAVGRMHGLRVIHKDLKPANIVVHPDTGELKLIDFALASEISRELGTQGADQLLEGSLPYMSPEQTGRMNRAVDYRSDYYSLGATFFELVTGQLPFQANDPLEWVHCHTSRQPFAARNLNREVPSLLSSFLEKLMAKDPADRYQSSSGMLRDLELCEQQWRRDDHSSDAELGKYDISEVLSITQNLVGRQTETAALRDAFDQACSGSSRLVVVSGDPGIGKSALIRQLHRAVVAMDGSFVTGKCDQVARNKPYGALLGALRQWLKQLQSKPTGQLETQRTLLETELGSGLSVLLQLFPELEALVSAQPPPAELPPVEAQNRLKSVLSTFIQCLATKTHPLVVFLDDLQWTDASTPELLAKVCESGAANYVLIVGAYRSTEVSEGHPLHAALERITSSDQSSISSLRLAALAQEGTEELLTRTLRCDPSDSKTLAEVVHEKCQGNPFFSSEFLHLLHRNGALFFERTSGAWKWDLAVVRRMPAADSATDLVVLRLDALSASAHSVLQLAACLGAEFNLHDLASLSDSTAVNVSDGLWEAVSHGLLVPLDNNYRLLQPKLSRPTQADSLDASFEFQHDRVQEAAYASMGAEVQQRNHLRIGRAWLSEYQDNPDSRSLVDLITHFNLGIERIKDLDERKRLAKLNLQAGIEAFEATAFSVSLRLLDAGSSYLSKEQWGENKSLHFALSRARVDAALMTGDRKRAADLCNGLFPLVSSELEEAAIFLQRSTIFMHQGLFVDAVQAIRAGLSLLDVSLPQSEQEIGAAIGEGLGTMQAHLGKVPVEELAQLPAVENPKLALAMQMLFHVVPAAIMTNPPLFIVAELKLFDLSLRHGLTPYSAKNLVDCGMLQGDLLGDYNRAYRLGKAGFDVLQRFDAQGLLAQVNFVFAAYVSPWGAPLSESLQCFKSAYRSGLDCGDHQHVGFSEALRVRMLMSHGRTLQECLRESQLTLTLLDELQATVQRDAVILCECAYKRLLDPNGESAHSQSLDSELTKRILASGNAQWAFQLGQIQMVVNAILGQWEEADQWAQFASDRSIAASTLFIVPEYHMLQCVIIAQARFPEADKNGRKELLSACDSHLEKLSKWAEVQPENFRHNYLLASAEVARIRDAPFHEIARLYEQAAEATGSHFVQARGLATELQAEFWIRSGNKKYGTFLLAEAEKMYRHWGCNAKLLKIRQRLPPDSDNFGVTLANTETLASQTVDSPSWGTLTVSDQGQQLDLMAFMKAAQAISSEVKTERLLSRLMTTILECAAATNGCLLLREPGTDNLVARVRATADKALTPDATLVCSLDEEDNICEDVVRLAQRTGTVQLVEDASQDEQYRFHPHVSTQVVLSICCLPIHHQGTLLAALYLENNALANAFTPKRVELMTLLSGQAAISINNALLYEHLEREVESRSLALAKKRRHMQAMLEQMPIGVLTLDTNLTIEQDYSRHLEKIVGVRELTGRNLEQLLFAQSDRAATEVEAHNSALRFSMGAPVSVANVNRFHLLTRCSRTGPDRKPQHLEFDWTWISGETGCVQGVLATVRDVTDYLRLQKVAERSEREAAIVSSILEFGIENFRDFCRQVSELLVPGCQLVEASSNERPGKLEQLFEELHNLKGIARSICLTELVMVAHEAESALEEFRKNPNKKCGELVRSGVQKMHEQVSEVARIVEKKVGRLWYMDHSRSPSVLDKIQGVLEEGVTRPSYPARALQAVHAIVQRERHVALSTLLSQAESCLPLIALELGKQPPSVALSDGDLQLTNHWATILRGVLAQTLHNSLAHGIELPEERSLAGKPSTGTISFTGRRATEGWVICLQDDGKGLALEKLRNQLGPEERSDFDLAESILEFGVSTAHTLTSLAGRGVGMGAVRRTLQLAGGELNLRFTAKETDGHRPFELEFVLPTEACCLLAQDLETS